jgi:hypothetical protein
MADGNNTYPFDASDVANPHLGTHTQEQKEAIAVEWNTAHEAEEAERNHYATKRKAEYDQLNQFEMQFDDKEDSTTTWVDKINEIKGRHPK